MDPLTITVVSIEELDTLVNALIPLINDWKMGKPVSLDELRRILDRARRAARAHA